MQLLGLLPLVLMVLLPTSAHAQSVTLRDLTGAWMRGEAPNQEILFIRADSTFTIEGGEFFSPPGSYVIYQHINHLRGDTISLSKSESPAVCRGERIGYCGEPGYKITLKDRQLTLSHLGNTGPWYSGTYIRVDAEPVQSQYTWYY